MLNLVLILNIIAFMLVLYLFFLWILLFPFSCILWAIFLILLRDENTWCNLNCILFVLLLYHFLGLSFICIIDSRWIRHLIDLLIFTNNRFISFNHIFVVIRVTPVLKWRVLTIFEFFPSACHVEVELALIELLKISVLRLSLSF